VSREIVIARWQTQARLSDPVCWQGRDIKWVTVVLLALVGTFA